MPPALSQISTHWPLISDPSQFVVRYAPAIEAYLGALLRDPHQVDEVRQDFLVRFLERGLVTEDALKGSFRHYLKASVRNAALTHLRKQAPARRGVPLPTDLPDDKPDPAEQRWVAEWRHCLLERVWDALETHEKKHLGNHAHTVLRLVAEHAHEDSQSLAGRAEALLGKSMRPDAFRKQLSRARRVFAERLVDEVRQTLHDPSPVQVEEELIEIGALPAIEPFLPGDWRSVLTSSS